MSKTGRNDPCPCGSGKKYKQCCLRQEREAETRRYQRRTGPTVALEWLLDHHGPAVSEAIDQGFFAGVDDEVSQRLQVLSDGVAEMVQINACEWLLAEGEIEVDGQPRSVGELLFGLAGPLLAVEQRRYLEHLFSQPLRLYEVEESRPGEGLWLRDTLDRRQPPRVWVEERAGSRSLRRGNVLGARLIPGEPMILSGGLYPIHRIEFITLRESLLDVLESGLGPEAARKAVSAQIIRAWLGTLTTPKPVFVDASAGEPILLVTDHYQVRDWDRLEAALAAQPDVEGSREEGWHRFEGREGELMRPLLSLNLGKGDRIEAFTTTLGLADEGRRWLTAVAGDCLEHRIREQMDPASSRLDLEEPPARSRTVPKIPPDELTRLMQETYHQVYREWADEPLPVLNDRTPRQAIASQRGRETVIELLKSYELGELEQAEEEGREPASLAFLWQALGLRRDEGFD